MGIEGGYWGIKTKRAAPFDGRKYIFATGEDRSRFYKVLL